MRPFFPGQTDVDTDGASSDAADLDDGEGASRDGHEVSREDNLPGVWPEAPPISRFAISRDVEPDYRNPGSIPTSSVIPAKRYWEMNTLAGSEPGVPSVVDPHPPSGVGSIAGNDTWAVDVVPDGGAPLTDVFNFPTQYGWDPDFAGLGWLE